MEPDPATRGPVSVISTDGDAPARPARVRPTWREGSTTATPWGPSLVASGVASAALGLFLAGLVPQFVPGSAGTALAPVVVWVGMAVPVAIALRRSRPRGLLRFHPADLLYGLVVGVLVRFTQGWLELAAGGSGAFPSFTSVNGSMPEGWLLLDVAAPGLISPVVEEFFFRGLLLVGLYAALRSPFGPWVASFVAWIASTALFALAHMWGAETTLDSAAAVLLLGAVCGALVLSTGRIWGAVLVHLVYNSSYVLLAVVGSLG